MTNKPITKPNMRIAYYGVRGSLPAPLTSAQVYRKTNVALETILTDPKLSEKLKNPKIFEYADIRKAVIDEILNSLPLSIVGTYGGNTTCIEVQVKDTPLIILDVGSGARTLGSDLAVRFCSSAKPGFNPLSFVEDYKNKIHILLTHVHWDHIQGFPFFAPMFFPGVEINIYGRRNSSKTLEEILKGQQQYPNFPIEFDDLPSICTCTDLKRLAPLPLRIGQANITAIELSHPDGVFAYKIGVGENADRKTYVFASDSEHKDIVDPRLVKFAQDADILYCDAQYLPEEYPTKIDWGHSTYEWAVKTALAANVGTVVLGHHEPSRDDFGLEMLHKNAMMFLETQLTSTANKGKSLKVVMGSEGLVQEL